jgi:hypothetical protein
MAHRGVEALTLPTCPCRVPNSVLIPDYADSAFSAPTEKIHGALRLAAADGVEYVKALFITTEHIPQW